MGPPGLWAELRRHGAATQLRGPAVERLLEDKKVAVDGAVWLYEAQLQENLAKVFRPTEASLKVIFERCVRWLRKGVLPIIVLEGGGGGRSQRVCSRGHGGLGPAFAAHTRLRELLQALGVPSVDADGEAEATCAALASSGACDFVATTDCDALLFGAPRVVKGLDLRTDGPSQCELWEASAIQRTLGLDRNGLIAAAFLIGCDYDLRSQPLTGTPSSWASQSQSQPSPREGAGVRAVGPRQAITTARELCTGFRGDALRALGDMLAGRYEEDAASQVVRDTPRCTGCRRCGHGNVRKACHGAKGCPQCGTSTGCLPRIAEGASCECQHCTSVAAVGGQQKVAAARVMNRVQSLIDLEPDCAHGFSSVVQQYKRAMPSSFPREFAWRGVDETIAHRLVSQFVQNSKVTSKLEPLLLEWTLRRMAACPTSLRADIEERRRWAAANNLQYAPISAKKTTISRDIAPYVLVDWALAQGDATILQLPGTARKARIRLADSCGLIRAESFPPRELAATFSRLLTECPVSVRQDVTLLLQWGRAHDLKLVPREGRYMNSGKVHIRWSDTDAGEEVEKAKLVVSREDAERFGCPLQKHPRQHPLAGQKTIKDFFNASSQTQTSMPADDSTELTAAASPGTPKPSNDKSAWSVDLAAPSTPEPSEGPVDLAPMTPPIQRRRLRSNDTNDEEVAQKITRKRRRVSFCGRPSLSSGSPQSPAASSRDAMTPSDQLLEDPGSESPKSHCQRNISGNMHLKRRQWRRGVLVPMVSITQVPAEVKDAAAPPRKRLSIKTREV